MSSARGRPGTTTGRKVEHRTMRPTLVPVAFSIDHHDAGAAPWKPWPSVPISEH